MNATAEDIRASVAAGIISEEQAARMTALAHQRAGRLSQSLPDDEPFELFNGFAEIFISIGLVLFISGITGFAAIIGGEVVLLAILAGLCWLGAQYYTLKRRLSLPSIVLVSGYAIGVNGLVLSLMDSLFSGSQTVFTPLIFCTLSLAALLVHYRRFRVPFTMFAAGLTGLLATLAFFDLITGNDSGFFNGSMSFDLRQGSSLGYATLVFGVLALIAALWFDVQDRHRVGRRARSAFWLHLLAAPSLVNALLMTTYNLEGGAGVVLTLVGFVIVSCFALIIDRRSFLTSGLAYLAALLFVAMRDENWVLSVPFLMLVLGTFVTVLGTFWTQLRIWIMQTLPDFPGKDRLPPYCA